MQKVDASKLVGLKDFEGGLAHERYLREALKQRTEILKHVSRSEAEQLTRFTGGKLVDSSIDEATEWVILVNPLRELGIYFFLQRYAPEFEDSIHVLYSKEALEVGMPAEDVTEFTVLYANSLIYYAKKFIKRDLPKISRYL